jgi:hypothetical protein
MARAQVMISIARALFDSTDPGSGGLKASAARRHVAFVDNLSGALSWQPPVAGMCRSMVQIDIQIKKINITS